MAERAGPLPGHPFPLVQISAVSENSWGGGILAKRRAGDIRDSCLWGEGCLLHHPGLHPSLSVQRKVGHITSRTTTSLRCWAENGDIGAQAGMGQGKDRDKRKL